jgi:dihydroorotase-like cyclic amidohydrolase
VFRREAQQQLECGGEANRTRPARQRPSIGSDHAPHTGEEKNWPDPESPWGVHGVQTLLPVMLDHVAKSRLTLERLVDLTCAGPARIFDIAAADGSRSAMRPTTPSSI